MLVEVIGENDEEVLENLWDVGLAFDEGDVMGFTLSFHFHPNDFFTNSVLTKHYSMKCEPDKEDPFSFEASFPCFLFHFCHLSYPVFFSFCHFLCLLLFLFFNIGP